MENQEKEKTATITIRLPASRIEEIKAMAKVLGISPCKMASTMVETGFVIADEFLKGKKVDGEF